MLACPWLSGTMHAWLRPFLDLQVADRHEYAQHGHDARGWSPGQAVPFQLEATLLPEASGGSSILGRKLP